MQHNALQAANKRNILYFSQLFGFARSSACWAASHKKHTHTHTQWRRTCCLLAAISACRCSCLVFMAAMASSFVIGGGAGMLFIESSNTAAAAPLSALIVYVSMYARLCRWEVHWARCSIWRRKFTERCVGWLQQEINRKFL